MPTLHVRDVPEHLYRRLRQRAQQENRSLSAEVITLLDAALDDGRPRQAEVLQSIRRRRFFNPAAANAPDSTSLVRQDRER